MSVELVTLVLAGVFVILLFIGTEIYAAIGITALMGILIFTPRGLEQFGFNSWILLNSFVITAVPLFIFMGAMLSESGVFRRVFIAANQWLGHLPGGMGMAVMIASAIFGAMSGSSTAAVATLGKIGYPEMDKLNYHPKFSLGLIAIGSTVSVLIPPSWIFVVYGVWLNTSIVRLFAAGMIPGIILTLLWIMTIIVLVRLDPRLAPTAPEVTKRFTKMERLRSLRQVAPSFILITAVLGSIFLGLATPTEAASVGAFLSIVFAVVYRSFTFTILRNALLTSVKIVSMMALIMVTAGVLAQALMYIGFIDLAKNTILALPLGTYGILAVIVVFYLILGCFLDPLSMLLLTMPFISPIITSLGLSIIWFGVVFVIVSQVGLITPPYGFNLFVLKTVVPEQNIMTIALGTLPFIPAALVLIILLIVFPQIALWFPGLL